MREPVTSKDDMYRRLYAGEFGNRNVGFLRVDDWLASPESRKYDRWGVRSRVPGDFRCGMHLDTADAYARAKLLGPDLADISIMLDSVATVTAMIEVWVSPVGLSVHTVPYPPPGVSWRKLMHTDKAQNLDGTRAALYLQRHLNPNSLADLNDLLAAYDGHCIELSACEECIGTVPHRNAVVWEVRCTDGRYEQGLGRRAR